MALPQGSDQWDDLASRALPAYVDAEGAAIWPEIEAQLRELSWITAHLDPHFPERNGIDPHVLRRVLRRLELEGALVRDTVELNGRAVTAFLSGSGLQQRRATEIRSVASTKRRLYRSFLGWAGNAQLCGTVAEELVFAALDSLRGTHLWLPAGLVPGQAREVLGQPLAIGGPLDAVGHLAVNPHDPSAGFVPFGVEVKNIRSVVYPWHQEAWDALAKLAAFPTVVPILLSRRLHVTTFRFFKDVGALGFQTYRQWFVNRGTARAEIDRATFAEVRSRLSFHDAVLVDDPQSVPDNVAWFFREGVRRRTPEGTPIIEAQADRWPQVAPLVAGYTSLRDELDPGDRRELWRAFSEEVIAEGFYSGGWAPGETDVEP
jgi:hypothetical protein